MVTHCIAINHKSIDLKLQLRKQGMAWGTLQNHWKEHGLRVRHGHRFALGPVTPV